MMDDDDPWGEEPSWAKEDENGASSKEGEEDSNDEWTDEDGTVFAAQHILVLIDCNPSMFVPCVTVKSDDHDHDDNHEETNNGTEGPSSFPSLRHDRSLLPTTTASSAGTLSLSSSSSSSSAKNKLISPFDAALMACEKLLRLRVNYVATSKSGRRDGVGIMLYGIKPQRQGRRRRRNSDMRHRDENGTLHDDNDSEEQDGDHHRHVADSIFFSSSSSTYEFISIAPPGIEQIRTVRSCLPPNEHFGHCSSSRLRDLKAELMAAPLEEEEEEEDVDRREEERRTIGGDGPSDIAVRMGHYTLCTLRSALHDASKAFLNAKCVKRNAATSKSPADFKTVWIFTNNDDPCHQNEEERKNVITVAKDAMENGLNIQVWPLPKPPKLDSTTTFDRRLFYDYITAKDNALMDRSGSLGLDGVLNLDELLEDIGQQWKKLRRAFRLPLLLPGWRDRPNDPGIMIDLFRMVQVRKKPIPVTVHQETNKMTVKTTEMIAVDRGEIITLKRIRTFAEFGGERVPISKEEVSAIKKHSSANIIASLILIGFKPIDSFSINHTLERSYFVYPNDDIVKGSRAAFAALHASMIRKRVLGVGELLTRVPGVSRLVSIIPQQEETEIVGEEDDGRMVSKQVTPPGFIIFHLPYEDDMRAIETDREDIADETMVNAAIDLIRHQKMEGVEFGYSFDNPALTKFWNYIESVALETPLPDDPENETKMDVDGILKSAGSQIEALKLCLPEDEEIKMERKRKAIKIEAGEAEPDWVHLYETGCLLDCTADTLKMYLRSVGEKLGGRKSELVERVKENIEERLHSGELKSSSSVSDAVQVQIKEECFI